jgi:hypothetical protein
MCVSRPATTPLAPSDPAAANAKLRKDQHRLTIRWGDVQQQNLDKLRAADPVLSGLTLSAAASPAASPHSIFKHLFGADYNQSALLWLLGSKNAQPYAPAEHT